MNGILVINKPSGFTSFDVVAVTRKALKTKKVGHMGTLDPMATGVLPILVGMATKLQSVIPETDKEYIAGFKLGISTDTQDITGNVLERAEMKISENQIRKVLSKFKGEIMQIPPMYSAVKKDGVRLYALARQGIEVERDARKVIIKKIELLNFNEKLQTGELIVRCSKGTYVRTLCNDIGAALGCGAVMTLLKRTEACGFRIEDSITLDEVKQLSNDGRIFKKLILLDAPFKCYKAIRVTENQGKRFSNGGGLMLERISIEENTKDKSLFRVYDQENKFLGLGIVNSAKRELSIYKLLCERI